MIARFINQLSNVWKFDSQLSWEGTKAICRAPVTWSYSTPRRPMGEGAVEWYGNCNTFPSSHNFKIAGIKECKETRATLAESF